MADNRPMTGELRAFLERVVAGEGGVNKADDTAGLPRGTFSRWLTTGVTPSADNLRRLADRIGARYGITDVQLFVMAGYLRGDYALDAPNSRETVI